MATLPLTMVLNPETYLPGTRRQRCQAAVLRKGVWIQCTYPVKPVNHTVFPLCGIHSQPARLPLGLVHSIEVQKESK